MSRVLVVPSIREYSFRCFQKAWAPYRDWDAIILVEDNPTKTFKADVTAHYCWADIEEDLGEDAWIISRRDSAIRSYGFLKAIEMDADMIGTLDDDCLPGSSKTFFEGHKRNQVWTPRWTDSIPGYRTRGKPYKDLGGLTNIAFSMSLWEGTPDLDACHMLAKPEPPKSLPPTRVMPKGQYFPFCGMAFAFDACYLPLAYFPLMGEGTPYGRFDDIWFGIICKKVLDHLDLAVTVGEPYINHSKASNTFTNLIKEAPGIEFNEQFWRYIDRVQLTGKTPAECVLEIGRSLTQEGNAYLKRLGEALQVWVRLTSFRDDDD